MPSLAARLISLLTAVALAVSPALAATAPSGPGDRASASGGAPVRVVSVKRAFTADDDGGPTRGGVVSRIKDLTDIEGVRENQLVVHGLAVGLNGTGDSLNAAPFTKQRRADLRADLERRADRARDPVRA